MFFLGKPLKTYTGARSTKITNLLFFSSPRRDAGSPRVFRCFEKVIFPDFEVRKCENPRVFTLSPLKNTKNLRIPDNIEKPHFLVYFGPPKWSIFLQKSPPRPPGDPRGASQENPRSLQEPPVSIFESPGSLWEPSGVDFGASGVDSGASGVEFRAAGRRFWSHFA